MTVADGEMDRFMMAVSCSDSPQYYLPEEITPQMYGRKIRIVGGQLDGYEGCLLATRGVQSEASACRIEGFSRYWH